MDAIDLPCEKIERRRFQSRNNQASCRFSVHITFEKRGIVFFVHLDTTAKRVLQLVSRVYWREQPGAEVH